MLLRVSGPPADTSPRGIGQLLSPAGSFMVQPLRLLWHSGGAKVGRTIDGG